MSFICHIRNYIYIYMYAFSRRFYPKRLTIAFRLYIFISTCVPWELNPQPFAQLTQCSTTEPHRNTCGLSGIIQSITSSEMCSLHLTHPSAHTFGAVGSQHCGARGAVGGLVPCSRVSPRSWTIPVGAEIRTHNLGLQDALSSKNLCIMPLMDCWFNI